MRATTRALPLLLAIACSQRVTPEDEYAQRERERPLMPVSAAPVEATAPAAPGGSMAPASGPAISVTVEGPAPGDEGAGSSDVLFVFVRPVGVTGGPPLAVRRIPGPTFPARVVISAADAMIPGTVFPDRVTVQARLDRDGDAFTTGPGDWAAESEPVAPGGDARLVLAPAGSP